MDHIESLVEEMRELDQYESQSGKLSRKLREYPSIGYGLAGLFWACAIGAYGYKRRSIPSPLYLMQLRIAAQGAVAGSLAAGIGYTMFKNLRNPVACASQKETMEQLMLRRI